MSKLFEFLGMDVSKMTLNDWQGVVLTLLATAAMVFVYFWVFNPKNKDALEERRNIPFEEDHIRMGDKNE